MKMAVIGANGQLGTDICSIKDDFEVIPLTHNDLEISDIQSVKDILSRYKPDVIINTAAYHCVDDCESNKEKAYRINALGVKNVAVVAQQLNSKVVHVSTDYVFGGEVEKRSVPYTEYENPVPLNIYGKSKLAGEICVQQFNLKHYIVRSSGLIGKVGSSGKGSNFVETILKIGTERNELRVVDDQVFSPTFTIELARKILQIIKTENYGIFHITNKGECSWFELAKEVLNLAGINTPVIPISSVQYNQRAKRPSYSVLDNFNLNLLNMNDMRPWQDALKDYLADKGFLK